MAGVPPAIWEDTGGEDIGARSGEYNIRVVLILALDTTTRAGSVALVRDGAVLIEQAGDGAVTHGQRLPRDVMRALDAASVRLAAIDLFAVAAGPGSFTGLRVGIATMQGLAMATDRRIVAVSALDALARAARDGVTRVAAWIDAQRGEVFAALYDADGTRLVEPSSEPPDATLRSWSGPLASAPVRFIGDGALRYRDRLEALRPRPPIVEPLPLLAGLVGRIAGEAPERAVLPHAVVPIYIRRADAELARAKRRAATP